MFSLAFPPPGPLERRTDPCLGRRSARVFRSIGRSPTRPFTCIDAHFCWESIHVDDEANGAREVDVGGCGGVAAARTFVVPEGRERTPPHTGGEAWGTS